MVESRDLARVEMHRYLQTDRHRRKVRQVQVSSRFLLRSLRDHPESLIGTESWAKRPAPEFIRNPAGSPSVGVFVFLSFREADGITEMDMLTWDSPAKLLHGFRVRSAESALIE